jgi:hypothetical protein
MALVQWSYERRRRVGPAKLAEQSGDYRRVLEALLRDAEQRGDYVEAQRLRSALFPPKPEPEVEPRNRLSRT